MQTARLLAAALVVVFVLARPSLGQTPPTEKVDNETIAKIKEEGLKHSHVMETISFLTDVHGPRLTGSPQIRRAADWTKGKLTEWGLENVHLETWGPFGRGWSLEGFAANLLEPSFAPLIAFPKAWSPSTPAPVRGEPVYLNVKDEKELEQYRGKLHHAIVLLSGPREVKALFDPPAARQSDERLLALANGVSTRRGGTPPVPGAAPTVGPIPPGAPGAPPGAQFGGTPEQRAALALQTKKWQLIYDEGAAVVLEPGRGDGGTVFVSAATVASRPSGSSDNQQPPSENRRTPTIENPFNRAPRPWAKDAPDIVPQVVVAVEHYNRIIRTLQKGTPVKLEIDLASRYYTDDLNSFNVIAEIPGSDLKDELVMLGGHFDSWHSGTGATDNAVGCGVALEAVRILQAIGAKPRRTIRLALWTGEEQGLLGSKAYVTEHFGRAVSPPQTGGRSGRGGGGSSGSSQNGSPRPPTKYEIKPDHAKFAAYFNLDNGTGKVRGVYLQGNETVRPIFRAWLAPFVADGAATLAPSNTGGTDHLSYDAVGLPGFQFIQDPLEYDSRTHHSNMDVFDRLQADDVKQASVIMASFVYHAAMRDEKLPRKKLDGEIVPMSEQQ